VCFLISGPGLLNAATALGQSLADSIPVLVVTAVAATESLGKGLGELHELPNQQAAASNFCRQSLQVDTPAMLIEHVATAFEIFETMRPGPVHLQIPMDVSEQVLPLELLESSLVRAKNRHQPSLGRSSSLAAKQQNTAREMVKALRAASEPLLLCGGGAVGAADQWCSIAEELDLPVITTANAKGLMPPDHPLAVGGSPSLGCTRMALSKADVVLAVGTEFGETDYDLLMNGELSFTGELLRIDIDEAQLERNQRASLALCADARTAAKGFALELELTAGQSARAARSQFASLGPSFLRRSPGR